LVDIGSGGGYRYEPRFCGQRVLGVQLPQLPPETVRELFTNGRACDEHALYEALPLVYDELRRPAHGYLRNESPEYTLQSTVLQNPSPTTRKRYWAIDRLWLYGQMSKAADA
jgi:hypothetical protein